MHPIFCIDLILDQMFVNLPTEDIFQCTRVNRLWNSRCRKILRESHKAIARLTGPCPCQVVKDFEAFLHSLAAVSYYNGIHLKIDGHLHRNCQTGSSSSICNEDYSGILNLQIKSLTIDWTRGCTNCLATNLVDSLIQLKSEDLEELNVISMPKALAIPVDLNFHKLKTLKVADELSLDYLARPFLSSIISNAKNLTSLYSTPLTPVQALQYLPEDRLQIIKDLAFSPETVLDEVLYNKFGLLKPQISSLMISSPNHEEDLCVENCWDALKQILVSSQHSLKLLSLDTRAALMLAVLKVPPLTNVTTVLLDIDLSVSAFNVREQLKMANFSRLFPNLSAISVSNDMILVNELPYYTNLDIEYVDELDLNSNITALDVTFGEFTKESANFLAELFGNVRILSIWCTGTVPYEELWSRWSKLETVWISQSDACILKNCDAEFCGISPEEAAELSQQDEEYLAAVHIVPLRPSVTHLKHLKEIQMTIYSGRSEDEYIASERFLSKVTKLVAFRRMPGLQVSIISQYL